MKNLYPNKTITGSIEVFPDIKREDAVPVIEKVLGVSLKEREVDEFIFYEADIRGFFYQLQLNYDWNLGKEDKKSISINIRSFWKDREHLLRAEMPKFVKNIPSDIREDKYGNIEISNYIAHVITAETGYRSS